MSSLGLQAFRSMIYCILARTAGSTLGSGDETKTVFPGVVTECKGRSGKVLGPRLDQVTD